jgi:hypothetical protein
MFVQVVGSESMQEEALKLQQVSYIEHNTLRGICICNCILHITHIRTRQLILDLVLIVHSTRGRPYFVLGVLRGVNLSTSYIE